MKNMIDDFNNLEIANQIYIEIPHPNQNGCQQKTCHQQQQKLGTMTLICNLGPEESETGESLEVTMSLGCRVGSRPVLATESDPLRK